MAYHLTNTDPLADRGPWAVCHPPLYGRHDMKRIAVLCAALGCSLALAACGDDRPATPGNATVTDDPLATQTDHCGEKYRPGQNPPNKPGEPCR